MVPQLGDLVTANVVSKSLGGTGQVAGLEVAEL